MCVSSQPENEPIIAEVKPGSAAAAAGIAVRSIIVACCGKPVGGLGEGGVIKIIQGESPTHPIELVLRRPQPS